MTEAGLTPFPAALQHGPRPLPLFLEMLRSETSENAARRRAALTGLGAYQRAPRPAAWTPPAAIAQAGRAVLRDYGGTATATPLVFVPSLINPPFILDIAPDRSLLRWLAAQGHRVLLVDWGAPSPDEQARDIAGHVADLLVPLLRSLGAPPLLAGYCLGGTMAAAAAALTPVAGLAMIAAPWRFAGFGAEARARITALWQSAEPLCRQLGLVPMEVLQSGFWQLDPARTIGKYERFAQLDPDSDAARQFVALEDWANAGAPLTYAAGAELFAFVADDAPGRGAWRVGGHLVDPHALACPRVEFVSMSDRIVPAATAAGFADHRALGAGHVGMVVGSGARAQLWAPLADWISAAGGARTVATA